MRIDTNNEFMHIKDGQLKRAIVKRMNEIEAETGIRPTMKRYIKQTLLNGDKQLRKLIKRENINEQATGGSTQQRTRPLTSEEGSAKRISVTQDR